MSVEKLTPILFSATCVQDFDIGPEIVIPPFSDACINMGSGYASHSCTFKAPREGYYEFTLVMCCSNSSHVSCGVYAYAGGGEGFLNLLSQQTSPLVISGIEFLEKHEEIPFTCQAFGSCKILAGYSNYSGKFLGN